MTMRCCVRRLRSRQSLSLTQRERQREQFQSFQLDQLSLHIYIYKLYRERSFSLPPSLCSFLPCVCRTTTTCVYIERKSLFKVLRKKKGKKKISSFISFFLQANSPRSLSRIIVHQLSLYIHTHIYLYTIIQYIYYVGYRRTREYKGRKSLTRLALAGFSTVYT